MKDKYKDTIIDTLTDLLESISIYADTGDFGADEYGEGYIDALIEVKNIINRHIKDITG